MARSHWGELIITVIALIGSSALSLVTPEVIRKMTAVLGSPENVTGDGLLKFSLILICAYLLRGVLRFVAMYVSHIAAWNFVGELTLKVYDKYQTLSMRYYQDKQTGQLMSRMVNDTRLLEVLIAHSLPDLLSNILIIIGVTVMIFLINPLLAALTLVPVPFVLMVSSLFSKKVAPLFRINQEVLGDLNGVLQDNLSGMKEIQAFGKEDYEHSKMQDNTKYYSFVNIRANKANAIFHPSVEFLTSLGTVIVVGVGGLLAMKGQILVADIVGFFVYLSLFYQPLAVLARLVEDVQTSLAGAKRVAEVLDSESEIKESPEARELTNIEGNIAFENVSFDYINGEHVLKDISFTAKKGEMVALVGPTGVGKTTIVSLLERFYDPLSGRITIDGNDIKDVTLHSLRSNVSLVLQDIFLFNGTIEENIAYGVEHYTRESIVAAAKTACADEFISKMPKGYDTVVGERGVRLSGGQKQRIAIARAVLRNTPVLILDEATSSVDTETESVIQKAIENLMGDRTIIVIAHRLTTIMRADNIIVLENGRIVESGTHSELLSKNGLYTKMCRI